tara:strand:- start:592 stop:801 length:210 start_codon:yes stop_codon:yes gene_type:complete
MENHNLDMRERYIITQALVIAIKELKKVPAPYTEISNIADMEYLLQTSFAEFAGVVEEILRDTVKNNGN